MDDRALAKTERTLDLFQTDLVLMRERAERRAEYPDGFFKWLDENPAIWEAFVARAIEVYRGGRRRFSARVIVEVIRWHTLVSDKDATFKINNNYVPGLARLVMAVHPALDGMFELRDMDGT